MVRVGVLVPDELEADGIGGTIETLWGSPLGGDLYVVENSPLDAYSLSWQDTVRAPFDADADMPMVEGVERKSGHRTVRAVVDDPGRARTLVGRAVEALGCTLEAAGGGRLLAIDVPPDADLGAVARALTDAGVTWEHADPTYEALYGDEDE